MTADHVLKVAGERIPPGTSLFDETTGEVLWYRGIEDGFVYLEGIQHHTKVDTGVFHTQIETAELVIESRPVRTLHGI